MDLRIVEFNRGYDRKAFDCGEPELNDWLARMAGQQERTNNTRTFLAVAGEDIAGYHASLAYQLGPDEVAAGLGVGSRPYPMPAVLLARLAVDVRYQGRGIGRQLLLHFLANMAGVSRQLGFQAVVVHAKNTEAATFYGKFGFQRFADKPLEMFMMTKDLRRTFDSR